LRRGVAEHSRGGDTYVRLCLEDTVRRSKHHSAKAIYDTIVQDLRAFATPVDDVSLVVIKR
jgi:hypothetical protein